MRKREADGERKIRQADLRFYQPEGYRDSDYHIRQCRLGKEYDRAPALMGEEKNPEVLSVFRTPPGFQDAASWVDGLRVKIKKLRLR